MKPNDPKQAELLERIYQLEQDNILLSSRLEDTEVLIANIPHCIAHYTLHADGSLVVKYVSQQIVGLTGYDFDFFSQKGNVFAIIHPADLSRVKGVLHDTIVSKKPSDTVEYRIVHNSGEVKWLREQVTLVVEDNRVGLVGVKQDISKEKNVISSIEKQEQHYKDIFENILDVYFETDSNGMLVEVSPSISRFFQYTRAELLGKSISMLFVNSEEREKFLQRLFDVNEIVDYEIAGVDSEGNPTYGLINMRLLRDASGKITGTVGAYHDITARKKADEQLRESESRFRSLLETVSNVAVYGYEPDGTIKYWNKASEELYGYTAEEAVGKNMLDLIVPLRLREEVSLFIANMVLTGMGDSSGELLLMRKNGEYVPVVTNYTTISLYGKEPEYFSVDIDQSQRKEADEAVVISEAKYRTLFEANRDGISIFTINPDNTLNRFEEMNEAAAAMLGYTKTEMLQLTPVDIEQYVDPEVLSERYSQIQGAGFSNFETQLKHKAGHLIKVEIMAVLIQYRGCFAIMNIVRDITDRKKTDELLRKLSNATEQSPASIIITDVEGIIEYVNPKFTEVTGFAPSEVVGKNPRMLKSGFTPPEVFESLWSIIKSGKEWRGEFQNVKKSGELYFESAVISPIFDDAGRITHFVAVKEDITARKQAEQALKENGRILREAQEVARVGHYVYDIKAGTWECSPVLYEIFGVSAGHDNRVESWLSLIAPEQRDEVARYLQTCINEYGRLVKDYKVIRACDRAERWISIIGEVEYTGDGQPVKMLGTIQDITERVQVQQEIVKAKEKAEESERLLKQSEVHLRLKLDSMLSAEVDMPDLKLADIVDLNQLQLIQDAFTKATGVASIITSVNGEAITRPSNLSEVCSLIRETPLGRKRCEELDRVLGARAVSQRSVQIEPCQGCGFLNSSAPICIGNKVVAFWMIGQACQGDVSEERVAAYATEIGVDPQRILQAYRNMSLMSRDKFVEITNLLWLFAAEMSTLAYNNIMLVRKIEEQKEYEALLIRAKEIAEENERVLKEKNEAYWTLNEELTEANTQLEESNEVIQEKAAKIKEREAILYSVINNIPFDIWARDLNGVCFLQNGISQTYWGSMIGNTPEMQGVAKGTLDKWIETNKRIYAGESINEEVECLDSFGVKRSLNSITAPIVENDEILGILGINIDISERKQFELDLIKAKEKAEESDRLKSAFLATMSHELRTPLNAIIGFSQILASVHELEKVSGFSNIINQQGKHLLGIIESMFELSLLDAGEVAVNIAPFEFDSLFELLSPIVAQAQKKWNRSQLTVKFVRLDSSKGLMINSDILKIKQIMQNLIDNALKFTAQGSVEYGYSIANNDLILFVKDTGKGIDPMDYNLIFTPFRQVDDSFSREFSGVGLGLSICQKMAMLLKGEITVQSELGKGSTFKLTIPNALVRKDRAVEVEIVPLPAQLDLTGLSILVAEDDPSSRLVMENFVAEAKGQVIVAKSGKDALDIATGNDQVALVLMDIKMSAMNGIEAMQRIKATKPNLPVIALTAFVMPGDQAKLLYYGFDDYLSKPIQTKVLRAKFTQHLRRN